MRKEYDIDALGLQNDKSPLGTIPALDVESYNVVASELQGTGPRFGMSVVPGQQHDTGVTLLSSEGTTVGYSHRNKVYGLLTQKLLREGKSVPMPIWLLGANRPNGTIPETYYATLDVIMAGDTDGPDADVASPLLDSSIGTLDNGLKNWRLKDLAARNIIGEQPSYLRYAQLSIGLADVQAPFLLGEAIGTETATNPGNLRFSNQGYDAKQDDVTQAHISIQTTFTENTKEYFGRAYVYDANATSLLVPEYEGDPLPNLFPAASNRQTARITLPAYSTGSAERALLICDQWLMSQSHAIIAMATGQGALLAVLREERDADRLPTQYADPQADRLRVTRTLVEAGTSYLLDGQEKPTGWAHVPAYTPNTPLGAESGASFDGAIHIRLGAADSGLLRKGLIYELGYSLYDATTATETNVCEPFRFETGNDDWVAISIFRNEKAGGLFTERLGWGLNVPVQKVPIEKVNYYQYRFYYRAVGSQEWLPGGHYWAADYLFRGTNQVLWLAQSPLGLTIGGSPGQFNDYSSLPKDKWKDVVVFQNRFFWVSDKQAIFSLRNNAFNYPIRNSISLPSGEFRGVTVHCFYGQSDQTGRLVFWANDAQYEGRFSGNPALYPVTVSPDYTGQFPLDGSDFIIQFRSSITAFSSRSAVVAEGALFFWGESGIFADSGVQPPNKISGPLEPWLGDIYDPTQTNKIHCVYNDKTKEVIWFYVPRIPGAFVSEALIFNAEKNSFSRLGFQTSIDWAQTINLSQEGARKRLACGKRLLIGHSFALYAQRTCFFDEKNATGDLKHGREFLVKEVTALPDGSRLVLADGFDVSAFADIGVGESFLISQAFEYTENESVYNGRYVITDIGSYYFDIAETLDPATFTTDKLLPIWLDKYSAIPFKLRTRFIMPGDRWTVYAYTWLAISLRIPQTILQDFEVGVFSNLNETATTQTLSLQANATKHCISALSFPQDNESTDGIGFGLELSGEANGASWRLDWFGVVGREAEDLTRFGQGD